MTIDSEKTEIDTKKKKSQEIQNNFVDATEEKDVFSVTCDISDKVSKF